MAFTTALGPVKIKKAKDTVSNMAVLLEADLLIAWSLDPDTPWESLHLATANL